jgi:hypothetical protein
MFGKNEINHWNGRINPFFFKRYGLLARLIAAMVIQQSFHMIRISEPFANGV